MLYMLCIYELYMYVDTRMNFHGTDVLSFDWAKSNVHHMQTNGNRACTSLL